MKMFLNTFCLVFAQGLCPYIMPGPLKGLKRNYTDQK